jgi:hypothetical protein
MERNPDLPAERRIDFRDGDLMGHRKDVCVKPAGPLE